LIVSSILIAFGLMLAVIFLEITNTKKEGKHLFEVHSKWFGVAILGIFVLIFIGAGGLGILNIPQIQIDESFAAVALFVGVMSVAVWVIVKESAKKK